MHTNANTHKEKKIKTKTEMAVAANKMCECACTLTTAKLTLRCVRSGGMVQTICTHLNTQCKCIKSEQIVKSGELYGLSGKVQHQHNMHK